MKPRLILKSLTVISQLTASGKQLDFHLLDEASNRVPSALASAEMQERSHYFLYAMLPVIAFLRYFS